MVNGNDVIVLCASYSKENFEIINADLIELMKGKYFINTARGELVDEKKLLKKAQVNHFKGLAIDVLSNENGQHNLNELRKLSKSKNIIITPHIAGATFESMSKTEEFIVDKLRDIL
jgi:D-3-phosphoglycerate dehydrogenase